MDGGEMWSTETLLEELKTVDLYKKELEKIIFDQNILIRALLNLNKTTAEIKLPEHSYELVLTHNEHKDRHITIHEIFEIYKSCDRRDMVDKTAKKRCMETDEVWELKWYPKTLSGYYMLIGPTLEEVLVAANSDKYK